MWLLLARIVPSLLLIGGLGVLVIIGIGADPGALAAGAVEGFINWLRTTISPW